MLQQLVWSVLLLALANCVSTQGCLQGQLGGFDGTNTDTIQYCYKGEWKYICHQDSKGDSVWDDERAGYACTQLGYGAMTGTFMYKNNCQPSPALEVVTLTNCTGPELTRCTVTPSEECNDTCFLVEVWCLLAKCTPGSLRLVGGTTEREGRVEVCVGDDSNDRRWRTVCTNNSQQLAGAVCEQLGYPFEVSTVVGLDKFSRGAYPEYRLSCELAGDENRTCEGIKEECSSLVEYGVICRTYEECSSSSNTVSPTTMRLPYTNSEATAPCSGSNAGIGVLVALLVAVTVGWIVTSVVLLRKIHTTLGQKQHDSTTITKLSTNQSYTQQEIQQVTADQTNIATDAYNRLNRNQVQGYLIDDTTYDYADHNLVRGKSTSAPAHPPPVGGVSDDEFYNAEDHTYAAVPKKNKAKRKSAIGEENSS